MFYQVLSSVSGIYTVHSQPSYCSTVQYYPLHGLLLMDVILYRMTTILMDPAVVFQHEY